MVTRISENLKIESIPARGNRAYIPFKSVSLTVTDCLTGRRTILLWTNSMGQWSIAQSDGSSLLASLKQPVDPTEALRPLAYHHCHFCNVERRFRKT